MFSKTWIFLIFASFCYCQDIPLVELNQGTVIGLKVRSEAASVDYFSFRGIPYAAPPIGDLRFKGPLPASNWTGILDARRDRNACLQSAKSRPLVIPTSEDCLYLNVFTPFLKVPEGKGLLPVMMYIHGGTFLTGSSDSSTYGPDFFMREEVVLVVINYRLGVFGSLNLDIPGAQGNAGLKDQILALKWIQKEIKSFGGNPNSVTIFGNSVGGFSVNFLYLSPLAQGLFHRAISQSGTAHILKTLESNYGIYLKIANELNCNVTDVQSVLTCLKTADGGEIIRAQEIFSGLQFHPTIDKNLGEEAALPEGLRELNTRSYNNVPYMVGVNKDEGMHFVKEKNYTEEMEDLETFLPLSVQKSTERLKNEAVEKIKTFYFENKPSNNSLGGLIQLYTDNVIYGAIQTIRSVTSRAKVYLYYFTFDGDYKHMDKIPAVFKELNITGTSHGDELGFLFYSERFKQNISYPTDDSLTILRMTRLWTNFAKFGNPTPDTSDKTLDGIVWKPVSKTSTRYLQIGEELKMINSNLEPERIAFWDSLYPSTMSESSVFKYNIQDEPSVKLSHGTIIGLKVHSAAASVDYFSFRGIPYAVPPINNLRFKGPLPALNWTGVLDARHDGNACLQPVEPPAPPFYIQTSEDCLYLNVYTPRLQVPKGKPLLPVMVYLHGGRFVKLSSDSRIYGPDFFMREDVVIVTINYRLGVFGFFNLELPGVQGNAGLKDQILALKWIKKEIRAFGGNPESVTLFGNSAGAMSIHFLYLSPLAQGLFHKAISQSGTAHKFKTIFKSNYDTALKLATELNCNETNVETVMTCLKDADAREIIRAQEICRDKNQNPYFYPTIDKNLGESVVLPENIGKLNDRKYCNVPYMFGVNKDEGILFIGAKNYTKDMGNLVQFLPLSIQQSTQQIQNEAVDKIKKFYFGGKSFSNDTMRGAINLYTDDNYLYSTVQTVRTLRSRTKLYLYQFSFDGRIKFISPAPLLNELNITGTAHTDEIGFLFYSEHLKQNITTPTDDSLTILRMVRLWANFAKYGNPTPDTSDKTLGGIVWKPVSETSTRYLQIGEDLKMINSNLEPERIAFWDSLYPSAMSESSVFKYNMYVLFITFIVIAFQLL